jgi:hypothetical protein
MLVIAHFGHWYISLPTFMAPVVILSGWVAWSARRERRRQEREDGPKA